MDKPALEVKIFPGKTEPCGGEKTALVVILVWLIDCLQLGCDHECSVSIRQLLNFNRFQRGLFSKWLMNGYMHEKPTNLCNYSRAV